MPVVQLLNRPSVVLNGEKLVLPKGKSSAILYYLAYQDDWVSREDLIFLFWPDSENKRARSNLRTVLSRSIGKLDGIKLEAIGDKVRWKVESDIRLLRQAAKDNDLNQLISLLSGELLEGYHCPPHAPEFESWLEQERKELIRLFKDYAFRLSDDLMINERYQDAAEVLKKVLEYDQFDEICFRRYLKTIFFSEGPDSAERVLTSYQNELKQELGAKPEIATLTLFDELKIFTPDKQIDKTAAALDLKLVEKPLHNLPLKLTTLVGREEEKAELSAYLLNPSIRLITLLGTGGMGKTRLAIALAEEQVSRFEHGVWFVPFASLQDPENILYAIAEALNFRFYGHDNPKTQLFSHLKNKDMLLILDNLEHLLEGTPLITELLESASQLRVVTTSREALKLQAEYIFKVSGLTHEQEEQEIMDAQRLFTQSAQRRIKGFELAKDNVIAINQICKAVEGMPLALELAASWLSILTPHEIAHELSQGIDILEDQMRDTPKRHKNIKGVFEYSWNLLSSREQDILAKLGVFRGGFTRDAAAQVTDATLPILASLVNKSFLSVMPNGRYNNHPLMLQFTQEKLSVFREEQTHTQEKQAAYYLALVEEAESHLESSEQALWFVTIEEEHDNLRKVLRWALKNDKIELGLRLSGALGHFWAIRCHFQEATNWFQQVLAHPNAAVYAEAYAYALAGAGWIAHLQSDNSRARSLLRKSLEISREIGHNRGIGQALLSLGCIAVDDNLDDGHLLLEDSLVINRKFGNKALIAPGLNNLGIFASMRSNLPVARSLHEESLGISQELGDKRAIAFSLYQLGRVTRAQGNYAIARSLFEKSLKICRELGNSRLISELHCQLGIIACAQSDFTTAKLLLRESLIIGRNLGLRFEMTMFLGEWANFQALQGSPEQAVRFWAVAETNRELLQIKQLPFEYDRHNREMVSVRDQLGEVAFEGAWNEGRLLTMDEATELALSGD